MLLPVEVHPGRGQAPAPRGPALVALVSLCVAAFCLQLAAGDELTLGYAHFPGRADPLRWLTSMFLHGGLAHLFGNMIFLHVFGRELERRYGSLTFLGLYLASGMVAVWAQDWMTLGIPPWGSDLPFEVLWRQGARPLLGASGAISGVMAAGLIEYGRHSVTVMAWWPPFLWGDYFTTPAWALIGLGFSNDLYQVLVRSETNVAHWAHLGGALAGAALVVVLRPAEASRRDRQGATLDPGLVRQRAAALDYARRLYLAGYPLEARAVLDEVERAGLPEDLRGFHGYLRKLLAARVHPGPRGRWRRL